MRINLACVCVCVRACVHACVRACVRACVCVTALFTSYRTFVIIPPLSAYPQYKYVL